VPGPGPKDPDDEPTESRSPPDAVPADDGSVDVSMSDSRLVRVAPDQPEGQPGVQAAPEEKSSRLKRTSQFAVEKVEDVVSSGVGKVGVGFGVLGDGLSKLGARVDKLPGVHQTKLGTGVVELGHGIAELGASLTELPKVARTRRGRVLVRSLIVGFLLVFAWVAVIIYFQVRGGEKPDLRPRAEELMLQLRDSTDGYRALFDASSPRFQEVTDLQAFAHLMDDMKRTLGRFKEIAAVNDTIVTRGPGGVIARVDLMLDFERGRARGTISLHRDAGVWKFLGIGIELPEHLVAKETSPEARAERVKAPAGVRTRVEELLDQLAKPEPGAVWDASAPLFQASVSRADFERIEAERRGILGAYRRVLDETPTEKPRGATSPGGTSAWFTALVEYERAIVTSTFGFLKDEDNRWRLTSYVVVMPMPRAPRSPGGEPAPAPDAAPAP
jgi:hypothetical protein